MKTNITKITDLTRSFLGRIYARESRLSIAEFLRCTIEQVKTHIHAMCFDCALGHALSKSFILAIDMGRL